MHISTTNSRDPWDRLVLQILTTPQSSRDLVSVAMSLIPASQFELHFSTRHYAMAIRSVTAVGLAAVTGAASRWAFNSLIGDSCGLLAANIIGCALIGWASSPNESNWDQTWLTVGLCGSLTSFAGLAVLLGSGLEEQRWAFVFLWGSATLISCGVSFDLGRSLGDRR